MAYEKSSLKIVVNALISFIILIILLIVLNILVESIKNSVFAEVVSFLTSLLGLFIALFLVGMINSLFWNFEFPLNLLAPLSGGILGVLIVNLIYKIFGFMQSIFYFDALAGILTYPLSGIVFFATIIIGYLMIINEEGRRGDEEKDKKKHKEDRYDKEESEKKILNEKERKERSKKKSHEGSLTWEDVGDEFRKVFYNIGDALNKAFDGKNKK